MATHSQFHHNPFRDITRRSIRLYNEKCYIDNTLTNMYVKLSEVSPICHTPPLDYLPTT